jgi:hypothetical protein
MLLSREMKEIRLREVEFSAMAGIILANEIEIILKNDAMEQFKSKIYKDLHSDLEKSYKLEEIGKRIGIFSYMIDKSYVSNCIISYYCF